MVSSSPRSEAAAARFNSAVDMLAVQQGKAQEAAKPGNPLDAQIADALAGLSNKITFSGELPKTTKVAALENKDMQRGSTELGGPT